ncbi:coiled-coil domain-containing protein 190 [Pteronotus mesoamericanus]|uniref:coiled-coil domain-containing protein 190 n=1 Tax=Pteronotus mesoamericanus TaxID=1884717 RepID=UPI0023ED7F83|nr:coiled-coil domain-containing protein 190 [Pteronotus parnellii mesoamericanus]
MRGTEGHTARAPLREHLDSERTHARQAEARLRQHLQRLERTCRHQLRLLSWEQRQLQRARERLQQEITKRKGPSSFRNGLQQRPGDPARGGERGAPRATGLRAPATDPAQGTHKAAPQEPLSCHAGLRDPEENKELSPSQSGAASDATEEKPADPERGASPAGGRGGAGGDEARSEDTATRPGHSAGEPTPPRSTRCAGNANGESSAFSFPELFAKAAHAHYLRHRAPPESERLLSLAEIFGHGDPAAQSPVASQSPPL